MSETTTSLQNFEGGDPEPSPNDEGAAAEPGAPKMHAGRVILRNIGFDTTEKHLRKEFAKHGPIQEVNVPLKTGSATLNRGFAFIEYATKEHALGAISAMHSKKWKGRTVALEIS